VKNHIVVAVVSSLFWLSAPAWAGQEVWTFDNLASVGGITPKVEGHPRLVDSPIGKAVDFNGKDDGLYFPGGPLTGAKTFSIEAIFRPEGGAEQQRWMHIAEIDPATGLGIANGPRFMFEIRVEGDSWYLDGFVNAKDGRSQALFFPDKLHPIGPWYAVQQTYDGTTYRTYVNGELQGEAVFKDFVPHGPSHVMIGARMNRVNYFHGAIAETRFTDRALRPEEFLKVPAQK
jgi:Concanavalin A-like lectin/glucanases superfamily